MRQDRGSPWGLRSGGDPAAGNPSFQSYGGGGSGRSSHVPVPRVALTGSGVESFDERTIWGTENGEGLVSVRLHRASSIRRTSLSSIQLVSSRTTPNNSNRHAELSSPYRRRDTPATHFSWAPQA